MSNQEDPPRDKPSDCFPVLQDIARHLLFRCRIVVAGVAVGDHGLDLEPMEAPALAHRTVTGSANGRSRSQTVALNLSNAPETGEITSKMLSTRQASSARRIGKWSAWFALPDLQDGGRSLREQRRTDVVAAGTWLAIRCDTQIPVA